MMPGWRSVTGPCREHKEDRHESCRFRARRARAHVLCRRSGRRRGREVDPASRARRWTGGSPSWRRSRCAARRGSSRARRFPRRSSRICSGRRAASTAPRSGMRTAPTAMNKQEIDVYVALADGLYLYDAKANVLNLVARAGSPRGDRQAAVREGRAGEPRFRRRLREDGGAGRKR